MSDKTESGRNGTVEDAAVSEAYRLAKQPVPPASLDSAILQMARDEVSGPQKTKMRPRWFLPLSVAATVVVAVSLGIQVMRTPDAVISEADFAVAPSAAPVSAPSSREQLFEAHDPMAKRLPSPPRQEFMAERAAAEVESNRQSAMSSDRPSAMQTAPLPKGESVVYDDGIPRRVGQVAQDRLAEYSKKFDQVAALADVGEADKSEPAVLEAVATALRERRSAAGWLLMIEELHRDGRQQQSRIEFVAFRRVYPQAELPEGFPVFE